MDESVGVRLRRLREERGMSLSELARVSGIGKGTISELENDRRGARLDTLFALTTALDSPLGALLAGSGAEAQPVTGASVSAILLDKWTVGSTLIEAYRATLTTDRQESRAHAHGIEETITVIRGRVLIGPPGTEQELRAGESVRYPGDGPHRFQALDDAADVILLMHYPPHTASEEGQLPHDR
ncbi:helix-turn-helix domain-containing protein [Microbacterium sp. SORGH_AS_0862]|uniref:helix-turn-helix domain-containing protein n=1 Tax=Microbacterium sp. SORGH_AS_0862 TaxID=3041789 RepID=UPI002793F71F|nr:XRE family transcriptional regulator [Microbacterium sp. SORGH_AS_0862]MDQ1206080.1 transcriptional regulator with XRE-family HTH domain [Microbacterium sp. SORGH_AS_0862]